jgi:DNA-directed RNA polymerase subunit M/transcription elongation factor TFIIS
MYYLKIRDDNDEVTDSLIYYCRNCGHEDATVSGESICVSDTQLRRSEQKYTHMVNEYTKYDPTLPRINTIKCPNQECSSNISGGGAGTVIKTKTAQAQTAQAQTAQAQTAQAQTAQAQTAQAQTAQAQTAQAQTAQVKEDKAVQEEENTVIPGNSQREVIYIRYDDINMKYVYLCVHCDTTWKTDNR